MFCVLMILLACILCVSAVADHSDIQLALSLELSVVATKPWVSVASHLSLAYASEYDQPTVSDLLHVKFFLLASVSLVVFHDSSWSDMIILPAY